MVALTLQEQETHLSMTADDRSVWAIYSDDQVMQRRLESIGATLVKNEGAGKHYTLPANQVTLRKPKKPMPEARKAQLAERMRTLARNTVITGAE